MSLSGQQRKELQLALIDAFPNAVSLEQMLAYELDKNLRAIAGEESLQDAVFKLIQTANSQGWVENLVRAACNSNPGNPRLRTIAGELLVNQDLEISSVSSPNIPQEQTNPTCLQGEVEQERKSLSSNTNQVQIQRLQQEPPDNISHLLVPPNTREVIGRDLLIEELEKLHKDIGSQESKRLAITFIHGIRGVGKTELAKEYIRKFKSFYTGGICWLEEKGKDVNSISQQILDFAKTYLHLQLPEKQDLNLRVVECWNIWQKSRKGQVLVVVDNLTEFNEKIHACLRIPIVDEHFKVLVTMPVNPSRDITSLTIEEEENDLIKEVDNLEPEHALTFLKSLIDKSRVDNEQKKAEELCKFLGYLPLAIELVGLHLRAEKKTYLKNVYDKLQKTKHFKSILKSSNGEKSINAVFCLSWEWYLGLKIEISLDDRKLLGYLLSLFNTDTIDQVLIERVLEKLGKEKEDIDLLMDAAISPLVRSSLIQNVESDTDLNKTGYRLHQIVQKFLGYKLEEELPEYIKNIKRQFCQVMLEEAKRISATPTYNDIEAVKLSISHIKKVAQEVKNWLEDEDEIIEIYLGVGRYYEGDGLYVQAKDWYCKYQSMNLDKGSPNFVKAQNALAYVYLLLEDNCKAKKLYDEAYEFGNKWFEKQGWKKEEKVEEWMSIVQSQDGLGYLYCYLISDYESRAQRMEQFAQAKKLLENALEERVNLRNTINSEKKLEIRLSIALTHEHLGYFYSNNHCDYDFDKAEKHYEKALIMRKEIFKETHPLLAESNYNLGIFYFTKAAKKSKEAVRESIKEKITLLETSRQYFTEALRLYNELYGNRHNKIALISLSLADICLKYVNYGRNNVDLNLDFKEQEKATERLCGDVIKIGNSLSYPYLKVRAYIRLFRLCYAKKAYKKAERYYNMGSDLARSEKYLNELEELEGLKNN